MRLVLVAGVALLAALLAAACSSGAEPPPRTQDAGRKQARKQDAAQGATKTPEPAADGQREDTKPALELPRGGRSLFPDYRIVAYYGTPRSHILGVLGEQGPKKSSSLLLNQSRPYKVKGRPVLPAFELIATMAIGSRGADGDYNLSSPPSLITSYLRAARAMKGLLILDIQPGTDTFLEEVKRYEQFLKEPDVGLALDSEWRWGAGETPAESTGHTTAAEINEVSAWLARLTQRHDLPQKLLALHGFATGMIQNRDSIKPQPGLAITFHVDGFGGRGAKLSKYDVLHTERKGFHNGFKLFYDEDVNLFSPEEVLKIEPRPDLITYQ